MDKKLRKSTNLCVEIMNREMTSKGKTRSRGTNQRQPFDMNVMFNLSTVN